MSAKRKENKGLKVECEIKGSIECDNQLVMNHVTKNCVHQKKYYETLTEYCNEVAKELAQRQSFYVIDLADILWKIQLWKSRLPDVDIFYAVKANADDVMLKLLAMLGLSFDCASQGEIEVTMTAGAPAKNIIFANTIKTDEELKFASDVGVELLTFDNEEELLKIQRLYPNAKLLVRVSPSKIDCLFDLSQKFGCSEEEAEELLVVAKELNLNVVGVSFHVGALCKDPTSYTSTIGCCRRLFDKARSIGLTLTILDIGGGFFGETGTEDIFYKDADAIQQALEEYFPDRSDVWIIAEPGCYVNCSAVRLVCTVIGKRNLKNAGEGHPSCHYFLNDGVYGSFFRGIECYGVVPVPLVPEAELKARPNTKCRIYGHTCCPTDVIQPNSVLPDLKVGEKILWENMGSYCRSVCSNFCGVPFPDSKYVFIKNPNLNFDWIENTEEIKKFLKENVVFIGCTEDDI